MDGQATSPADHAEQQDVLLAPSRGRNAYVHNPRHRFLDGTHLPLRPHDRLRKADIDDRRAVYSQLAGLIWNHLEPPSAGRSRSES